MKRELVKAINVSFIIRILELKTYNIIKLIVISIVMKTIVKSILNINIK